MDFFSGAGTGLLAGLASYLGGQQASAASWGQAKHQMHFQEWMSSTAHRREVDDLRNAGLNPILSATGGGSPMASGAQGVVQNSLAEGVGSALEAMRLKKEIAQTDSQIALNEAAGKAQEAAAIRDGTSAKQMATAINVLEKQMPAIESRAKADKKQADWDYKMSDEDNIQKRVNNVLGTVNSAKDMINPFRLLPSGARKSKNGDIYDKKTGEVLYERTKP